MNPQQALELLYSAFARVPLIREDHAKVEQAFRAIQDAITPKKPVLPAKKPHIP